MSDDGARRGIPSWLHWFGWIALAYALLWASTYVTTLYRLRKVREIVKAGGAEILTSFDPALPQPHLPPENSEGYFFIGNLSCPCPLIISYDLAQYARDGGRAQRLTCVAFWDDTRDLGYRTYWEYGK